MVVRYIDLRGDSLKLIRSIKDALQEYVPNVEKKLVVITGYVTVEAFDFLESLIQSKDIEKTILFKFNLLDWHNHSSSFDFDRAIENGWNVYIDNTIHAKNYVFDDKFIIQGSFNLTTASLGIVTNTLKDNGVMIDYYEDVHNWISNKFSNALHITPSIYADLKVFLNAIEETVSIETIKTKQDLLQKTIFIKTHNVLNYTSTSIGDEMRMNQLANCFLESFKETPQLFGEYISEEDLRKQYQFEDNDFWINYIIHINSGIETTEFDFKNALYEFTPKIYKYDNRFYIQPLMKNTEATANKEVLTSTLMKAMESNIGVDMSRENIFIFKDAFRTTIKFKRFFFIDGISLERENVLKYYQNHLNILFESNKEGGEDE